MTDGYVEFEFDLPEALLERLVTVFGDMDAAPLAANQVAAIPEAQGVYQLFMDGQLSYIGKTDQEAGLKKRLTRHSLKIQHRLGLDPARVTFKAVRVFVFTAVDLETQLIKRYGVKTWNGSGFGSNDPGRERDTTTYKADHFDALFPIDIDRVLPNLVLPAEASVAEIFRSLRAAIPFTFRAQNAGGRTREPHPDFAARLRIDPAMPLTARNVIVETLTVLPAGWQAVKLPSHIILYKDNKHYPSGEVLARS